MIGLCKGGKVLCRRFVSPLKCFQFKEWNLSVAEVFAIKPHLFFISHSSLGMKENEDDLGKKRGSDSKGLAALFSKRHTMQRCFSFYNNLVSLAL